MKGNSVLGELEQAERGAVPTSCSHTVFVFRLKDQHWI